MNIDNTFPGMENLKISNLSDLAGYLYNILFPIGIALAIGTLIIAGYGFMTSEGKPEKVKEAGERMTSAITGSLFILLSVVILRFIIKLIDPGF